MKELSLSENAERTWPQRKTVFALIWTMVSISEWLKQEKMELLSPMGSIHSKVNYVQSETFRIKDLLLVNGFGGARFPGSIPTISTYNDNPFKISLTFPDTLQWLLKPGLAQNDRRRHTRQSRKSPVAVEASPSLTPPLSLPSANGAIVLGQ